MAEPLYHHRKRQTQKGLKLYPKYVADGKEKRVIIGGGLARVWNDHDEDDNSDDETPISYEAMVFGRAKAGDERAQDYLKSFICAYIRIEAIQYNWKIDLTPERAQVLARIVFAPFFSGLDITDQIAAEFLGVSRRKYQLNWKPKLERVNSLITGWRYQLDCDR